MYAHNWMLEILADLSSFAKAQGHDALGLQLDETLVLAAATFAQDTPAAQADDDDPLQPGADRSHLRTGARPTRLI